MPISHGITLILFSALLLVPGLVWGPCGIDIYTVSIWAQHFAHSLWEGVLYPRWLPEMFAGHGSPVFFYYPPLIFYIYSLFFFLRDAFDLGYAPLLLTAFLGLVASGYSCYFWIEKETTRKDIALILALLYVAFPFHLAHSWYSLLLLGQVWAYVWFPLLLSAALCIRRREPYRVLWFSAALAGLLVTNMPNFILCAPVAVLYALVPATSFERARVLKDLILAVLLGFGLAAVYVLPAVMYQEYSQIQAQWTKESGAEYISQLFRFTQDPDAPFDMPLYGARLVMMAALLGCGAYAAHDSSVGWRESLLSMRLLLFFGGFALVMNVGGSEFLWETIPLMHVVQIPARFYAIATLAILGLLAHAMARNAVMWNRSSLSIFCGFLLIFFTLVTVFAAYLSRIDLHERVYESDPATRAIAEIDRERYLYSIDQFYSYLTGEDLVTRFYAPARFEKLKHSNPRIELRYGDARVEILEWRSRFLRLSISSDQDSRISIRQFYFPGWIAESNGVALHLEREVGTGKMSLVLPEHFGAREVTLTLYPLLPEVMGRLISLWALGVWVIAWVKVRYSARH